MCHTHVHITKQQQQTHLQSRQRKLQRLGEVQTDQGGNPIEAKARLDRDHEREDDKVKQHLDVLPHKLCRQPAVHIDDALPDDDAELRQKRQDKAGTQRVLVQRLSAHDQHVRITAGE